MTKFVKAKFANGVLTPLEPLDLPEGTLVLLNIDQNGSPEPETAEAIFQMPPNHLEFAAGIDLEKLNQLNDELVIDEYLQKERRIRERGG